MLETKGFENFIESVWHFLKADVHVLAKVFMLFFAIIGVCCIMFTGIYYIKRKLSNPLKYQRTPVYEYESESDDADDETPTESDMDMDEAKKFIKV
mmetsp:Transcript_100232/g.122685  ORF Transcript_100232/g.122685 Transcript_100232/m.122685 type:complete len:96 (-) Transcript_100232:220-507(-)